MAREYDARKEIESRINDMIAILRLVKPRDTREMDLFRELKEINSQAAMTLEKSLIPIPIQVERVRDIAKRLGISHRAVRIKIDRNNDKIDRKKIQPLWVDADGLVFAPGIFEGEKRRRIRHNRRRSNGT